MDVFLAPLTHGCGIGAASLSSVASLRTPVLGSSAVRKLYGPHRGFWYILLHPIHWDDPTEVMSAAKVKEREGHGYEYPVRGSIVNLGSPVHGAGYLMPALAGYRQ